MKVIFLDHDGVICLSSEHGSRFKKKTKFDKLNKKAVKVLNEILEKTDAEIVVSSDWRLHATLQELQDLYKEEGIIKIPMGVTTEYKPSKMGDLYDLEYRRIREINMFMKSHPEIENWVAVDDLEMFALGDNFVHCPKRLEGIKQLGIKEKIIKILNNET